MKYITFLKEKHVLVENHDDILIAEKYMGEERLTTKVKDRIEGEYGGSEVVKRLIVCVNFHGNTGESFTSGTKFSYYVRNYAGKWRHTHSKTFTNR
jgi:hypothetical protein